VDNYYFSKTRDVESDTLEEAVRAYALHLREVSEDPHSDKTYRDYHKMYHEIISGYLDSARNLQPLIENIVSQIHVRFPWVSGTTKDALGMIGAELSHILEKHSRFTVNANGTRSK